MQLNKELVQLKQHLKSAVSTVALEYAIDTNKATAFENCADDLTEIIDDILRKLDEIEAECRVEQAQAELALINRQYERSV